jgi:hypothetical protein
MVAEWLLTRISQKSTSSEGGFLKLYEPLVSGIWHSGQSVSMTLIQPGSAFRL